jgi:hypothetical protein
MWIVITGRVTGYPGFAAAHSHARRCGDTDRGGAPSAAGGGAGFRVPEHANARGHRRATAGQGPEATALGSPTTASGFRLDVPKLDDEHAAARPVLGDLQEIDHAGKPGLPRELGGDVGEGDLEDLCHDYLAGREHIPPTDLHVRSLPQADRGGDLAAANWVAERADELHSVAPTEGSRVEAVGRSIIVVTLVAACQPPSMTTALIMAGVPFDCLPCVHEKVGDGSPLASIRPHPPFARWGA